MKTTILNRYEKASSGEVIIDVAVHSIEELFNNFDRTSAFFKKDLDQDFVDYLIDSVREIKQHDFLIRINLQGAETEERMLRVQRSIKNYFSYLKETERHAIQKLLKKSAIYLLIGVLLLSLSFWFTGGAAEDHHMPFGILTEGLTIAAWVSMWQAFANIIFEIPPLRNNIRRYRRIMSSKVVFKEKALVAEF